MEDFSIAFSNLNGDAHATSLKAPPSEFSTINIDVGCF